MERFLVTPLCAEAFSDGLIAGVLTWCWHLVRREWVLCFIADVPSPDGCVLVYIHATLFCNITRSESYRSDKRIRLQWSPVDPKRPDAPRKLEIIMHGFDRATGRQTTFESLANLDESPVSIDRRTRFAQQPIPGVVQKVPDWLDGPDAFGD